MSGMLVNEKQALEPDDSTPSDSRQSPLSLARIQEYVWARYVEFRSPPFDLDEEQALAFLEEHYHRHPLGDDSECFHYGILAFERSFTEGAPSRSLLCTALRVFQAYRAQTAPDFSWDAVEDRYADVLDALERLRLP